MIKKFTNFNNCINYFCKKNNKKIYYMNANEENEITYHNLLTVVKNFDSILKKYKIKKQSKVLVLLDNSKALLLIFLSLIYNQRIFVPVNPNSGISEIKYITKKTKPTLIITDGFFKNKINSIKGIKTLKIDHETFVANLTQTKIKLKKTKEIFKANSIAQILFTSGSTGNPKGVDLSHESMLSNLYDLYYAFKIKDKHPKFLSATPLYHNNGQFIPSLLPFMLGGSTFSISPDTSLINFWPVCLKFKINYSSIMATHINYFNTLKKIKHHSLKNLFCGGAKLDKNSQIFFEKKFNVKVLCNYGLTETSSIAATETPNQKNYVYGSVGKALSNNKIKIVNIKKKYGEIWIKGKNIFKKYLGEKKLTKSKFDRGWFKTGDLGYLNRSRNLFIKDRIDNMVIVSGENIYPSEIENHIFKLKEINLGVLCSIPDKITQNKLILVYEGSKKLDYSKLYNFL